MIAVGPLYEEAKIFLSDRTGLQFRGLCMLEPEWFCITGWTDPRTVGFVITFEFKNSFDTHFTLAVDNPRLLNRRLIRAIYTTVFNHAARVTALVMPGNEDALRGVERMGFKPEGVLRRGYDGTNDAILFGLLPEDCPYLIANRPAPRLRTVLPTHAQHPGVN